MPVNEETVKYLAKSLDQANCTKNEKAWKACECLNSSGNDISVGTMAELFGIERFRVSRTNTIFAGGSNEMVKAYKDGAIPLNVAYRIVRKTPVAQRDKALAEYLAAPKGRHGRRNPKPGLVRGNPLRAIERSIRHIYHEVRVLNTVLEQHPTLVLFDAQLELAIKTRQGVLQTMRRLTVATEANV